MWSSLRKKNSEKTRLEQLIENNGGSYRTSGLDSVLFQVYTNVELVAAPPQAQPRGIAVELALDAPPGGAARDEDWKKREAYWEHSRQLQSLSLVALVVVSLMPTRDVRVYLGVIASRPEEIAESAKADPARICVRVRFFDGAFEFTALGGERISTRGGFAFLVDNKVMYESVRPFLHKLQTTEPTEIPFARYIAPAGSPQGVAVDPPRYALTPGFKFDLGCLAKPGLSNMISNMDVVRPLAAERARLQLKRYSILDPSQVDAVVDTLTREVSLIQG